MKRTRLENLEVAEVGGTTMFRWFYWWKLSRKAKKNLKMQCEISKKLGPAEPPTPYELESFKKEYDMGWDSQMIQPIKNKRTYFEASLN